MSASAAGLTNEAHAYNLPGGKSTSRIFVHQRGVGKLVPLPKHTSPVKTKKIGCFAAPCPCNIASERRKVRHAPPCKRSQAAEIPAGLPHLQWVVLFKQGGK